MFTLESRDLSVEILDPVEDSERFGTRYNTGGYIFQILDAEHGPLLTGPTYPDSFNPFDGQGIPDGFRNPLRATGSNKGLIVGVGICDLVSNEVIQFCKWDIERSSSRVSLNTSQAHQGYTLDLNRIVEVTGRTVSTRTRLHNTGAVSIPVRWYPHPFFPHPAGDELCRFSARVAFDDTSGYELSKNGFIRRIGWPWETDYYRALDHEAQAPLEVLQRHPALGLIGVSFTYVPGFLVIWGNERTFSFEPYFERTVAAGQEVNWGIEFHF